MICGLLEPTSGFVEMKNLKVSEYSVFLSQFISVMPQNDMLFDTLSVDDHVRLACMVSE
jgi:ABC-type multidrug transport system ATPase subunit